MTYGMPSELRGILGIPYRHTDLLKSKFYDAFLGVGLPSEIRHLLSKIRGGKGWVRSTPEIPRYSKIWDMPSIMLSVGPHPGKITGFAALNHTGMYLLRPHDYQDLKPDYIYMRLVLSERVDVFPDIQTACEEGIDRALLDMPCSICCSPVFLGRTPEEQLYAKLNV